MYSALDISKFIINYSNEKNYGMSNLKLQKVLYIIQAYFLVEFEYPCFYDKIEAWGFGVVVPNVFKEFAIYGGGNIYVKLDNLDCFSNYLFNSHKQIIYDIIEELSEYTATDLVDITMKQLPYGLAYRKGEQNEVSVESIKEYFSQ